MAKSVRDEFNERLREAFVPSSAEAFAAKYDGKTIETYWNIFHMRYVSRPVDFDAFTPDQQAWLNGYETAWLDASAIVQGLK